MLGEADTANAAELSPPPGARASDGRQLMRTAADALAVEATPLSEQYRHQNMVDVLRASAAKFSERTAIAFQLQGTPNAPLFEMTYRELMSDVVKLANLMHREGVKPGESVAMLLPNIPEAAVALYAGQAIGAINPINPLLEPEIIASILQDSEATVLITLAPFPKTDVAEKAAKAVAMAPKVKRVIEIDLLKYVSGVLKVVVPLIRPKRVTKHKAKVIPYAKAMRGETDRRLIFERKIGPDAIGALFHTGGTTGAPKLAQHRQGGMTFHAWSISNIVFNENTTVLCALPLFHVFAAYVLTMAPHAVGARMVMITPQGFRGDGVIENFWKLVARHKATFFAAVPTAIAALNQRKVDADVSSLRYLISGSAPLPQALFREFEERTGAKILEGYGMTEATCVTSCNPPDGERKIGSVGFPLAYVKARICQFDGSGNWSRDCEIDQIGEICFKGPNVFPGYKEQERNVGLFFDADENGDAWVRTGDLGRIDADGYIWITGRAKDLIIRGGHNIDPGLIEEALAQHPAVAFVGAIGQPDAYAGELPCAYVELKEGAAATAEELQAFAAQHVAERAARPAAVSVMDELPKTAVGKTFKPALRKEAIARVFGEALEKSGIAATVEVEDDEKRGMVAVVSTQDAGVEDAAIGAALDGFARPWRRA
ncbi:MAG: acyl-CoA synthetase [Pseudomonadota bacterium]